MEKIIRTICHFTRNPSNLTVSRLGELKSKLESAGYTVQTTRICSTSESISALNALNSTSMHSIGNVTVEYLKENMNNYLESQNLACNIELAKEEISLDTVSPLFEIIKKKASKTFSFAYTFNNAKSSPYYPSANYEKEGFSIGLQPTDLAKDCNSLEEWFEKMKEIWAEINNLFSDQQDYLGIDSSIAPLYKGDSSLINIIKRFHGDYLSSFTSDIYTRITKYIKTENPKSVGLCGIMMPCLEDFELALEYEKGEFNIERNIYVSLHSGLGIDTYPIGIDEDPKRVVEILKLLQALSNKYNKPLSARFVSDGKARIGEKTNLENPYLKDVVARKL